MPERTSRASMWPTFVALPLMLLAMFNAAPMGLWVWTNRDSLAEASAGEIARTLVSWPMPLGVLETVAAVWLFAAAWLLILRWRASRARLIEWCVAAIALALVSGAEMVWAYVEYTRDQRALADSGVEPLVGMGDVLAEYPPVDGVSVAMLLVLDVLTPVLVCWWVRRPRIRAEMAGWGRK